MMKKTWLESRIESGAKELKDTLSETNSHITLESHEDHSWRSPRRHIENTLFNFKSKLLNINNLEKKLVDTEKMSGVYFLYDEDELVYVGQTDFLYGRLAVHKTDKKFDKFSFYPINDRNEKNLLEWFYIKKFKPIYNISENCCVSIKVGKQRFGAEETFVVMNEYYEKNIK